MIRIEKYKNTGDELLKEFGIEPNSYETIKNKYSIFKDDKEIGYFVLSDDEFSHMEFENEFGEEKSFIYLSYIEMDVSGHLRESFNKIKELLSDKYDYLILHIDFYNKSKYERLVQIYKHLGFKALFPSTLHDYFGGEKMHIDIDNEPLFMFLNLK